MGSTPAACSNRAARASSGLRRHSDRTTSGKSSRTRSHATTASVLTPPRPRRLAGSAEVTSAIGVHGRVRRMRSRCSRTSGCLSVGATTSTQQQPGGMASGLITCIANSTPRSASAASEAPSRRTATRGITVRSARERPPRSRRSSQRIAIRKFSAATARRGAWVFRGAASFGEVVRGIHEMLLIWVVFCQDTANRDLVTDVSASRSPTPTADGRVSPPLMPPHPAASSHRMVEDRPPGHRRALIGGRRMRGQHRSDRRTGGPPPTQRHDQPIHAEAGGAQGIRSRCRTQRSGRDPW